MRTTTATRASNAAFLPMRRLPFPFPIRLPKLLVYVPVPRMLLPPPEDYEYSFRVIPVVGDGRCLFRSIITSLATGSDCDSLSFDKETRCADELRELAYKMMCSQKAARYFMRKSIVEGSYAAYLEQMRAPGFYAGEAEIVALSKVLKLPISVYLDTKANGGKEHEFTAIATYGEKYKYKEEHIRVLYNGIDHYNAIRVVKKNTHT